MTYICQDLRNIGVPVGCGNQVESFDAGWKWVKVGHQDRAECLKCGNRVRQLYTIHKSLLNEEHTNAPTK